MPRNREEPAVEAAKISQNVLILNLPNMFQVNKKVKSKYLKIKEFPKLTCGKLVSLNGNSLAMLLIQMLSNKMD